MKPFLRWSPIPRTFRSGSWLWIVVLVGFSGLAHEASAETHRLREQGRTLVEAEAYSEKSSDESPKSGESSKCSGASYLGYFWSSQWFELTVDVPQMLNYHLTFRASSEDGTQVKVQLLGESGDPRTLATVDLAKTKDYKKYAYNHDTIISLPKGLQTLRFENTGPGADIDYVMFTAGSKNDVVSTEPAKNVGPDINPLKGFGSSWWRETDDLASVGFQYIEWGKLEPEDDVFDWDAIEEVLDRAGSRGRHLILQFAVDWDDWGKEEPAGDSHYKGPQWLLDKVGENRGPAFPDDPDSRISRATQYNHPVFIEEATEAIKALCDHFKDDPRTFVLQTGLLGYWGEWHNYPRTDWSPTDTTKKAILDAYLSNLGPDGLTQIRYPEESVAQPQARLGYTNGSATPTQHGYEFGQAIEKRELWKNGPVGGEWPPSIEAEYWKRFFETDEGRVFLEQGGYSTMTAPEDKDIAAMLPGWKRDAMYMQMHRRMGYNFQTTSVRHLALADLQGDVQSEVVQGEVLIEVDLQNVGIAPFYKDWDVQLAILDAETSRVVDLIETDTDIRKLMPNESTTIVGSSDAKLDPRRRYQIGLRILQPRADKAKTAAWKLKPRNVYVVLANDVEVSPGVWAQDNSFQGGWNILDTLKRREPKQTPSIEGPSFPFEGAFRPTGDQNPRSN